MAEEFDEQGNPIVDPPDPVVTVTAERDDMAGRARAAEERAKAAEDRAQLAEDLARQFAPKPLAPQPTGLTEEQFYEIQSNPVAFDAYQRQIAREEAEKISAQNMRAVDQRYGAVAQRSARSELAKMVPDWDEIGSDILELATERKMTEVDLLASDQAVKDAADIVRGRRFAAGKYKPTPSEEEEVVDDGRSAMLAHGTAVGGASRGSKSEWDGFSKDEIAIAKQDGLKPDEFRERYLKSEPGDFVNMPRKKVSNA